MNSDGIAQATEGNTFQLTCQADGDFKVAAEHVATSGGAACLPVQCAVPKATASKVPLPTEGSLTYFEIQPYQCAAGFSLDGLPSGGRSFSEVCQADGTVSDETQCKEIDWCSLSECTDNGACVNGMLNYTCNCKPGFKNAFTATGLDTCIQIDECVTQGGTASCSVHGKCIDETQKYKCECNEGYEVITNNDLESCEAVVCGVTPTIAHAASPRKNEKISFPESARFTCISGYTLDAAPDGAVSFSVKCQADKSFAGEKECLPVKCGAVSKVAHAKADKTELVFGEFATYTCNAGHTISGAATASGTFTVGCSSDGTITAAEQCVPVTCGKPTSVLFSKFENVEVVFGGSAEYSCMEGYTTTGEAGSDAQFSTACQANGDFEECLRCMPVSCGIPELVGHAQMPLAERTYNQVFDVECETGYTIDQDAQGDSSFVVRCGADGKYKGVKECLPVSCGVPEATSSATSADPERFFQEVGKWTCKEGYSTDGSPTGRTAYSKVCTVAGAFGESSPRDCQDIDYCEGSPCGPNGVCKDSGVGVPAPGYSCTCHEGFEIGMNAKGGETCKADDCTGNPCGDGGACTDLSKATPPGPPGMYACDCNEGYKLVDGPPMTCARIVCPNLPEINHLLLDINDQPIVEVVTWTGKEAALNPLTNYPVLKSFDGATFTCDEGYSTDGSLTPESQTFEVKCEGAGYFNKVLKADAECQPVACDNIHLPSVAFSVITNQMEGFYEYGDIVNFKCISGYTTTGEVGGVDTFTLPCQANGKFPLEHESCLPVSCGKPSQRDHSARSTTASLIFGTRVTYTCADGYTLNGDVNGASFYTGICGPDGQIGTADGVAFSGTTGPQCEPVVCGAIPTIAGATVNWFNGEPCNDMQESLASNEKMCSSSSNENWDKHIIGQVGQKLKQSCTVLKGRDATGFRDETCASWCEAHGGRTCNFATDNAGGCSLADYNSYSEGDVANGDTCTWNPATGQADCDWSDNGCNQKWNDQICACGAVGSMTAVVPETVKFRDPDMLVVCNEGYTLGGIVGADAEYNIRCESTGSFTQASDQCREPRVSVAGEVTDAQSASKKLNGVTVKFYKNNEVVGTTTSDWSGRFSSLVPTGDILITGEKDGYIQQSLTVHVQGQIRRGQGADLALSKIMPAGSWRVVLTWAEHSRDLDSHTYFGNNRGTHVYYPSSARKKSAYGVDVVLDRDDVDGFGPETTTFSNVGQCTSGKTKCLLVFKVKNYTPQDGELCESEGVITVYVGNGVAAKYTIDPGCGVTSNNYLAMFTLDASKDGYTGIADPARLTAGDTAPAPAPAPPPSGSYHRRRSSWSSSSYSSSSYSSGSYSSSSYSSSYSSYR